jgi:hypothetical protein
LLAAVNAKSKRELLLASGMGHEDHLVRLGQAMPGKGMDGLGKPDLGLMIAYRSNSLAMTRR